MKKPVKLVKFPKPKIETDTVFLNTLVWILDQARKHKISGYALVYVGEDDDGHIRTIEAAKAFDEEDKHHVLGAIRRMEYNYMSREWPSE